MPNKLENIMSAVFGYYLISGICIGASITFYIDREFGFGILFSVIALIFMLIIYWITNPYKIIIIKKEETNEEHRMSI